MEMYLSVGVSTIAALIAAHRTGRDLPIPATFDQRDIACIDSEPFAIVPTDKRKRCGGDIWRRGVWLCC